MAERLLNAGVRSIVDPACGAGALLLAALELASLRGTPLDPSALAGFDSDAESLAAARDVLTTALGDDGAGVRLELRDTLADGLPAAHHATPVIINPPWGIRVAPDVLESWRGRVGPEIAALLRGEVSIYSLFVLDAVLKRGARTCALTPIHWFHRRALHKMRLAMIDSGRLESVTVLRKRVFRRAPDMIPMISSWSQTPSSGAVSLTGVGLKSPLPFAWPLPERGRTEVDRASWRELPFAVFPLLLTDELRDVCSRFARASVRVSDTSRRREERLFHIGDGIYKSKVMSSLVAPGAGRPLATRGSQLKRYRLGDIEHALDPTAESILSESDRHRFGREVILMHAMKKASAPWRLAAALSPAAGLAVTNNFIVLTPEQYDGDLGYPLALLNSRLFNAVYTAHFPGVNIEAYTVGSMPLPWPVVAPAGEDGAPTDRYEWARERRLNEGIDGHVYSWLSAAGRSLGESYDEALDRDVEAVVAGLFNAPKPIAHGP